jgi:hypothetical protein
MTTTKTRFVVVIITSTIFYAHSYTNGRLYSLPPLVDALINGTEFQCRPTHSTTRQQRPMRRRALLASPEFQTINSQNGEFAEFAEFAGNKSFAGPPA